MTVKEFDKFNEAGCMYAVVETKDVIGWATERSVEIQASRGVITERYGDREVVGFEIKTSKTLYLYIR